MRPEVLAVSMSATPATCSMYTNQKTSDPTVLSAQPAGRKGLCDLDGEVEVR